MNRSTQYVTMKKKFVIRLVSCQKLHWCQPSHYIWHQIVNIYIMIYKRITQFKIANPMVTQIQQNMNN